MRAVRQALDTSEDPLIVSLRRVTYDSARIPNVRVVHHPCILVIGLGCANYMNMNTNLLGVVGGLGVSVSLS